MSNEQERREKEAKNLFKDAKFVRQAWQSLGRALLERPAKRGPLQYDKDGEPTMATAIDGYSFDKLQKDIEEIGKENRQPTELEMILQSQILKARYDTPAAVFIRDTLGAKPVDESKVDNTIVNNYSELTDEELELLAEHRRQQAEKAAEKKEEGK